MEKYSGKMAKSFTSTPFKHRLMRYLIKTPWLLKKYYGSCIWDIRGEENIMYLTFDDGPHPQATPFVLDQLKEYNAKATFFCIGKNVDAHPALYRRMLD